MVGARRYGLSRISWRASASRSRDERGHSSRSSCWPRLERRDAHALLPLLPARQASVHGVHWHFGRRPFRSTDADAVFFRRDVVALILLVRRSRLHVLVQCENDSLFWSNSFETAAPLDDDGRRAAGPDLVNTIMLIVTLACVALVLIRKRASSSAYLSVEGRSILAGIVRSRSWRPPRATRSRASGRGRRFRCSRPVRRVHGLLLRRRTHASRQGVGRLPPAGRDRARGRTRLWWPFADVARRRASYAGEQIALEGGAPFPETLLVDAAPFSGRYARGSRGSGAAFTTRMATVTRAAHDRRGDGLHRRRRGSLRVGIPRAAGVSRAVRCRGGRLGQAAVEHITASKAPVRRPGTRGTIGAIVNRSRAAPRIPYTFA